jgi:hypothetical protein
MARTRFAYIFGPALALAVGISSALASPQAAGATVGSTATSRPASHGTAAAPQPAAVAGPALPTTSAARAALGAPAAVFKDDTLNNDSCTVTNAPTSPYFCLATGWYVAPGFVHVISQTSRGGAWFGFYPIAPPPLKNTVVLSNEVSCATPDGSDPTCLVVGEHYSNPKLPVQYAASTNGSESLVAANNPSGTTWSSLNDVSCPTVTSCLLVGAAGTTRKTAHGIVYISHATAYSWNGTTLAKLSVPAPAGARTTELGGLSCATTTTCMAVGNYTNAHGAWLTYAAAWNSGTWQVQSTPNIRGERFTTFQGISCSSATTCMAVGDAYTPGSRPFAELWSDGTWQVSATPPRLKAGFVSVSCPDVSDCVAVGWHGTSGLIEAWTPTGWTVQRSAATKAPFSGDRLMHVSCVTVTACAAVGFRFNPRVRRSTSRTLAEAWNGHAWQLQQTQNF